MNIYVFSPEDWSESASLSLVFITVLTLSVIGGKKCTLSTSSLANDDKWRWMKSLQWSLPCRGSRSEQGIQVHFSSCCFDLTYFFNHKVAFEEQQETYRKHLYLQKTPQLTAQDYSDWWIHLQKWFYHWEITLLMIKQCTWSRDNWLIFDGFWHSGTW